MRGDWGGLAGGPRILGMAIASRCAVRLRRLKSEICAKRKLGALDLK